VCLTLPPSSTFGTPLHRECVKRVPPTNSSTTTERRKSRQYSTFRGVVREGSRSVAAVCGLPGDKRTHERHPGTLRQGSGRVSRSAREFPGLLQASNERVASTTGRFCCLRPPAGHGGRTGSQAGGRTLRSGRARLGSRGRGSMRCLVFPREDSLLLSRRKAHPLVTSEEITGQTQARRELGLPGRGEGRQQLAWASRRQQAKEAGSASGATRVALGLPA
jgi:hypothetical protein